jgi:hypothetical protein
MIKALTLFLAFLYITPAFGQDEDYQVRIRHYQRKATLNYLPLPNSSFKPADFKIMFPDTMYNQAQIEVKKLKIEIESEKLLKKAYIIIASKNKQIQQVNIAIHPKYEERFEAYLKAEFNFKLNEKDKGKGLINNQKNVLVVKERLKRQINYKFSIADS